MVRANLDVVFAISAAAAFSLWLAAGLRFSPDSNHYLSYALAFHSGGGLSVDPMWPPLYPILLAAAMRFAPVPGFAASLVAGVSLAATSLLLVLLLRRAGLPGPSRMALVATLYATSGVLGMYTWAWSEGPFLAFLLAALYFAIRHFERGSFPYYVACALSVAAAALTRYAGYFLIAAFAGYTLLWLAMRRAQPWRTHARYAAAFALCSLPSLAYTVRNLLVYGRVRLANPVESPSLLENVARSYELLSQNAGVLFWMGLLGTLLAIGLVATTRPARRTPALSVLGGVLWTALMGYGFTVVAASRLVHDAPHDLVPRYLAPIQLLLLLLVGVGWAVLLTDLHRHGRLFVNLVCLLVFALVSMTDSFEFRRQVDLALHVRGRQQGHRAIGFDRSLTAANLRRYFDFQLARHPEIEVTALVDTASRERPSESRTLFLRRWLYAGRRGCTFRVQGSEYDYVVSCAEPRPISITYRNMGNFGAISSGGFSEQLRVQVEEQMRRAGEALYLVYLPKKSRTWEQLEQILGEGFEMTWVARFPPYFVTRLVPRAS